MFSLSALRVIIMVTCVDVYLLASGPWHC